MLLLTLRSTLFPYTTLFRSRIVSLFERSGSQVQIRFAFVPLFLGFVVAGFHRHFHGAKEEGHERSEEHTSELQSRVDLVCRLLLEKKKPLLPQMLRL